MESDSSSGDMEFVLSNEEVHDFFDLVLRK